MAVCGLKHCPSCYYCVYNKQVGAFVALGPVATVGHIKGIAKYLSDGVTEEEVGGNVIWCLFDFEHKNDDYIDDVKMITNCNDVLT